MRALLAATFFFATPLGAEPFTVGDLEVDTPMLRVTVPTAPVGGGFLKITNRGMVDDVLLDASIDERVAGRVELHEMRLEDGVMSMLPLEGGLLIPAGETVTLAPGGFHIMLMGLEQPLVKGARHAVTLTFASAGEITIDMPVEDLATIRATFATEGHGDGHHGGHGDDHSTHHGN